MLCISAYCRMAFAWFFVEYFWCSIDMRTYIGAADPPRHPVPPMLALRDRSGTHRRFLFVLSDFRQPRAIHRGDKTAA